VSFATSAIRKLLPVTQRSAHETRVVRLNWGERISYSRLKRRSARFFRSRGWTLTDRRSYDYAMVARHGQCEVMLSFRDSSYQFGVTSAIDMALDARLLGPSLALVFITARPPPAHIRNALTESRINILPYTDLPEFCDAHADGKPFVRLFRHGAQ
jgi:hypothetical protein